MATIYAPNKFILDALLPIFTPKLVKIEKNEKEQIHDFNLMMLTNCINLEKNQLNICIWVFSDLRN